ncbi:CHAD domain-containing protein [Flavitalea antarctica]
MRPFEKFVYQQFRSLISHLEKWNISNEPETLHRIRVDIKKIKATFPVIDENKKDFKSNKRFRPLRQIFRSAGAIRDADVLIGLLEQYQIEANYDELIPGDIKESIAAFNSALPVYIANVKRLWNKLKNDLKRVDRGELKRYVRRKKKEIELKLNPQPQMSSLHKTRKAIKEIIYLSEADDILKEKEKKFYDQMQDVLGELHDKEVLLELLRVKNNKTIVSQYKAIESACESDKKVILGLVMGKYGDHSIFPG